MWHQVRLSLFNYQDDTRSNKHKNYNLSCEFYFFDKFSLLLRGRVLFCVNKCPTRCDYTQFILFVNCSACFGWSLHPTSGVLITVSTASGTSLPLLLPVVVVKELSSLNSSTTATGSNNGWPVPDTVDKLIGAPDDWWRNHPKHVEQFTDKINCV
jgi:hypothetical protein